MFVLHIWGFRKNDKDMQQARQAGWMRYDLAWERLLVKANQTWLEQRHFSALCYFNLANLLADFCLKKNDPRRATARINIAIISMVKGNLKKALFELTQAQLIWSQINHAIDNAHIAPRSKNSLFHLKMEVKHRDIFLKNMSIRLKKIADETTLAMISIAKKRALQSRHFSRWKGEKPSVFDDTRKLLAAALLIIDIKWG